MLRFMKWFFVKRRLTHADFSCCVFSMLVGGWWGFATLLGLLAACALVGGLTEAWEADNA